MTRTDAPPAQPLWITALARGLLAAAIGVVVVAVLLPNTWMAELRVQWRWFSEAINRVEALWPAVDMVHVVMFGAVGVLAALAFPAVRLGRLLLAIAALACATELAQIWVPGRTASVGEAVLDVVAGAAGVLLVAGLRRLGRWPALDQATRIAFLGGVLLLPLQDWGLVWLFGHGVSPADLLFVVALGLRGLTLLAGQAPLRGQPIHGAWLAYVLVLGFSIFVSPAVLSSFGKWIGVVHLTLLAVLALDLCAQAGFMRKAVMAWIIAASVTALGSAIGLVGFYLAPGSPWLDWLLLSHYGSLPPGPWPRVTSLFANPNMLCNYLVVAVCLLLAAIRLQWIQSRTGYALFLLLALASVFTASPGLGGLALAVGLWCGWLWRDEAPRRAALVLGAGVFAAIAMFAATLVNLAAPFEQASVRGLIWPQAWATVLQHPWRGVGLGQDVVGVEFLSPSGDQQWLTDAHNMWLNLAGQAGLPAVLAMVAICWLLLRGPWPRSATGAGEAAVSQAAVSETDILRVACGTAFVGAFLYQGMAGSFEDARQMWLLMGMLAALAQHRTSSP